MLFTLGMGEITAFVGVEGEAESAFVLSEVIFHKVGIFVEIDGFKGQFSEPLASVAVEVGLAGDTAGAGAATRPVLEIDTA